MKIRQLKNKIKLFGGIALVVGVIWSFIGMAFGIEIMGKARDLRNDNAFRIGLVFLLSGVIPLAIFLFIIRNDLSLNIANHNNASWG
jgi:4-amino-4-deoxy-L-arabinose transferase-like glycosyltransferase